ncbi:MAG: hypothetical protein DI587_03530 [Variovorax paradoxus]|nr:MAG: hypothetical protein DI583_03530 [Variovorax paradoxus]PZQ15151.1 MAG: hypothetical protein DI587_03530 [Variovorax paradoxus]
MIRAVAVVSLLVLLVLGLYLPSVQSPAHVLDTLREEHAATAAFWGLPQAERILERALAMQAGAAAASPLPSNHHAPRAGGTQAAVATEMASVSERLLRNAYFRAVDAVLMRASYRLAGLLQWLPWLLPLVVVATLDGALVRVVKAKEFRQHDPELFAVWCSLLIVVACGTVIACVLPMALHPATMAVVVVGMGVLLGLAVGSFHRRG